MLIFAPFSSVESHDATLFVEAIAPSEGEGDTIVKAAVIRAALPDFTKAAGTLGQMGRAASTGTVDNVTVADDGAVFVSATVIDPTAIRKVQAGVYRGFGLVAKVRGRDARDPAVATAIELQNISLVDVPDDPSATLALWKVQPTHLEKVDVAGRQLIGLAGHIASITARIEWLEASRQ
ncbi:hypothetical protein [Methylobacterium soli]|uniref:Uncharacterized protein n=1 Tax=Methylobacterium soli TaxID=553447 RepID=A0A6L3SPW4_9HYPH|nr:hypothetical protein [Methylobacterium soli]KAB1072550.1 hypothetical protein F6X53_28105 [Methylobacterium soli]GJE43829.1 hypothetical protein AEGHOMDF_3008 [Methylobacterium soli]